MAYSFQTFNAGQVLTASQVNQVEVNIRDHVHGVAGVSGGNNVVAIQTNLVSVGNTTTDTLICSFGIPADAIGSSSAVRLSIYGHGSLVSVNADMFFNTLLGGTGVSSLRMEAIDVVSGPLMLEWIIAGAGTTSLQIISSNITNIASNFSGNTGTVRTAINTTNQDATTALNMAVRVDFDTANAANFFKRMYAMAERVYL